ncbi:zinc-binding alcohol dehydrogenase family protein [Priestia megaterium]|nr:zinc-binding alcohol dehydrogenase family protein [Priestia megaterium]MCR8928884.1 zinc-binding alcohol dehydrogenase family protein [Priestia megaterium]
MTHTMKAVGLYRYRPISNPESLLDVHIPKPEPAGRDLLVKVMAISVNPVDTKVRSSKDTVETNPRILGWDVAGIVQETGPDCTLYKPGDEVYYSGSMVRPGGYSEYHAVDERIVGIKPKTVTFAEAASLPLTSITAWEILFERLSIPEDTKLNRNKSILIIGAAGGVGSIAVQLASLVGLTVIGTTSREETTKWVKEHGAFATINHAEPLTPQLNDLGFNSVDYIFCLSAPDPYLNEMEEIIVPQGKIAWIVDANQPFDATILRKKSVTLFLHSMFTRSMYQTPDMIQQHNLLNKVSEWVDAKKLKTTMSHCYEPINAENLRMAHKMIESRKMIGKIVLQKFI